MDYISGFFGYFYSTKKELKKEEEDSICNLESTLTPNCLNELPENKFININFCETDNK